MSEQVRTVFRSDARDGVSNDVSTCFWTGQDDTTSLDIEVFHLHRQLWVCSVHSFVVVDLWFSTLLNKIQKL